MIELRGTIVSVNVDFVKPTEIIVHAKDSGVYEKLDRYKDKDCSITIKTHRKKRSLNANAYMWVLVGKLSDKTGIPKDDIYRHHIKEIGVYRAVEIDDKAVNTLIKSWGLHGTGWIAEKVDRGRYKGFSIINLYYGSSTYNTKQMSRLIDNVVQDCKEQGIETLTPQELQALKDDWKRETR